MNICVIKYAHKQNGKYRKCFVLTIIISLFGFTSLSQNFLNRISDLDDAWT